MDFSFWTARASSFIGVLALAGGAWLAGCDRRADLPKLADVPRFTLTDQTGADFDSAKLANHVWVADFIFTNCPGPCPRMSSQMRQVQTALAVSDVRLVSFTIDPARDTPQALSDYAVRYAARPGVWYFLTGPVESLRHLDRDVFHLGDIDGTLQHSTRFVLMDRKSRVRGYYLTSEPDAIPRLISDAKRLLRERS
ncbi:MAG TPA: SCO family protein [Bryobacteraceae bacterium]|nr:SCO family protein [Bryobacteraceae bacterium]